MIQTVVKLTEQSVLGEIESVLDTYPYNPYQQTFAHADLRQELISFVVSRKQAFIVHHLKINPFQYTNLIKKAY